MNIIRRAVEEPMRWIAANAGHEGSIVVQRVKEMTGDEGFNAQTEQYEDLVAAGVIDPAKVVRSALQHAASIASLLLTTEAVICQIPEPDQQRAPSPAPWGCDEERSPRGHGYRAGSAAVGFPDATASMIPTPMATRTPTPTQIGATRLSMPVCHKPSPTPTARTKYPIRNRLMNRMPCMLARRARYVCVVVNIGRIVKADIVAT